MLYCYNGLRIIFFFLKKILKDLPTFIIIDLPSIIINILMS